MHGEESGLGHRHSTDGAKCIYLGLLVLFESAWSKLHSCVRKARDKERSRRVLTAAGSKKETMHPTVMIDTAQIQNYLG